MKDWNDRRGTMACGHPLAARQVKASAIGPRAEDRRLGTFCWACLVEKEVGK